MPPLHNLIAGSLMLALAGYGGLKAYLYYEARHQIDRAFAPLTALGKVEYADVAVSLFGPVSVLGAQLTLPEGESVRVGRLELRELEHPRGTPLPAQLSVRLEDLELSAWTADRWLHQFRGDAEAGSAESVPWPDLRSLDYRRLQGDVELAWRHDPAARAVELSLKIRSQELADFDLSLALQGVDPLATLHGIPDGSFRALHLEYHDHSLLPRLFAWLAQQREIEPDILRETLRSELIEFMEARTNLGEANIEQLRRFVARPDRLMLRMEPYEPVPFREIGYYSERDLPLLFNLQLVSTPRVP